MHGQDSPIAQPQLEADGCAQRMEVPIREVRASLGAGSSSRRQTISRTVPGLRVRPAAHGIDLDDDGNAIGLS